MRGDQYRPGAGRVTGRVQYGPRVHASTALAVCANYLPVARA